MVLGPDFKTLCLSDGTSLIKESGALFGATNIKERVHMYVTGT